MDIELSDEQRFLQETVRKFLEHEAPLSATRDRAARDEPPFADGYWPRAAELGLASLLVPEEYGGPGTDQPVLDLVVVAEEMGRLIAPGPLLPVSVVADTLARAGTDAQKERYLPALAAGELIAAWAAGEKPDMWDPGRGAATARQVKGASEAGMGRRVGGEGDWVLSGEKASVEAGDVAGVFLVTAQTAEGPAQFLVPRDAPGLAVQPLPQYDLGRRFADITLNDAPAQAMIGEPGQLGDLLERQYLLALTVQAAETVGLLERIWDVTLEYVQNRYAFGRPLSSYQALKHRIADHKLWLEAALGLSTALAGAVAAGDADARQLASVTKAHVGDQAVTIISDCGQLHGGIAMTWEHDLHLYLRRATANKFLYGSPAQHRERLCQLIGL